MVGSRPCIATARPALYSETALCGGTDATHVQRTRLATVRRGGSGSDMTVVEPAGGAVTDVRRAARSAA